MKRLLTRFYETGVGDASLYTYIPVDFHASPSDTTLAKIAVGDVIIIARCKIAPWMQFKSCINIRFCR